jgi:hypothetical protein
MLHRGYRNPPDYPETHLHYLRPRQIFHNPHYLRHRRDYSQDYPDYRQRRLRHALSQIQKKYPEAQSMCRTR